MCCSTNPTAMLMLALDALIRPGSAREVPALFVLPSGYVKALVDEMRRTGEYLSHLFDQLPPHEFMGVAISVEDAEPFPQLVTLAGSILRIACTPG